MEMKTSLQCCKSFLSHGAPARSLGCSSRSSRDRLGLRRNDISRELCASSLARSLARALSFTVMGPGGDGWTDGSDGCWARLRMPERAGVAASIHFMAVIRSRIYTLLETLFAGRRDPLGRSLEEFVRVGSLMFLGFRGTFLVIGCA